jgi:DNA helicase-2/ATP-dependent DNA helicase PcrA
LWPLPPSTGPLEAIVKSLDASFSGNVDLREDLLAWREITRDLAIHLGKNLPLERFLQELQTAFEGTDTEATEPDSDDHPRSKGREFDIVHVIGMVERDHSVYPEHETGGR